MTKLQRENIPKDIVEEIIALGEGYKTEFIESLSSYVLAARSICAFLNTKGGNIFIGINDRGIPIGVLDEDEEVLNLEKILPVIIPRPILSPSLIKFNRKNLILIRIEEGNQKPYYVKENSSFVPYIRLDNLNVKAGKKAIKSFVKNSSISETGHKLKKDEKIILDLFEEHKKLSLEQIIKTIYLKERKIKKILRTLSKKSLIIQDDRDGAFYYNDPNNLNPLSDNDAITKYLR